MPKPVILADRGQTCVIGCRGQQIAKPEFAAALIVEYSGTDLSFDGEMIYFECDRFAELMADERWFDVW